MENSELEELEETLLEEGFRLIKGCTRVKVLGTAVPAGNPEDLEDQVEEEFNIAIQGENLLYSLEVKGNSMIDLGIYPGDSLLVKQVTVPRSNDIVVARNEEGNGTVKVFFRDENDKPWLIPANPNFDPIELDNSWTIVAMVKEIIHARPAVTNQFCMGMLARYKSKTKSKEEYKPTYEDIEIALNAATAMMKTRRIETGRIWFAVYRAMVDCKIIKKDDYTGFLSILSDHMLQCPTINVKDLSTKMDILSFRRSVKEWDIRNAPVGGRTFYNYQEVATAFIKAMPEELSSELL